MLPDYFGSDVDYDTAMGRTEEASAPPPRPFVVCRRCLRDDADTNQAACRCCGGELHRYGVLCDVCDRREAVKETGDGRPICQTCEENQQEDAWVRSNEEAQ